MEAVGAVAESLTWLMHSCSHTQKFNCCHIWDQKEISSLNQADKHCGIE